MASGSLIEYGTAGRALSGERVSGDRHVVCLFPDGALLAVIDGLGHGIEAAKAAAAAAAVLEGHAQEPVVPLVRRCHDALMATRGVVMSVVSISSLADTVTWLGVGNVDATLVRAGEAAKRSRETLLTRGGIVGYQLPPLHASVIQIGADDILALGTDGLSSGFADALTPGEPPQRMADRILDRYGKDNDDALVLIARYRGRGS